MNDFVDQLKKEFGEHVIFTGPEISNRASSYWDSTPISAKAVIKPRNATELSEIIKKCNEKGQVIVTHGGLTGCAKAADTTPEHVVISTERMTKIEEIDEIGGTISVEAGAILEVVQNKVAEKGFYFPLDLGARGSCTIGGNTATNAGGINVIRYGMMRNHILGLEAVLADGTIISSMNKMIKNNAGYDLKQLFIGSEGTLGIVTRVVVKLETAPVSRQTVIVSLENFSNVIAFLNHMKKSTGPRLSAYEVMWGSYYNAVTEEGNHKPPLARGAPFYVITECTGTNESSDEAIFMDTLERALEQELISDAIIPKSEAERQSVWIIREGFEAILANEPLFLYDVSLPIKNMEQYIKEVQNKITATWPSGFCHVIGHIGDGNLHLMIHPGKKGEELHNMSDEMVYGPLKVINGSVSAEHGIGREKKQWLAHSRSNVEIELMKTLKKALDPNNILNPGVVF